MNDLHFFWCTRKEQKCRWPRWENFPLRRWGNRAMVWKSELAMANLVSVYCKQRSWAICGHLQNCSLFVHIPSPKQIFVASSDLHIVTCLPTRGCLHMPMWEGICVDTYVCSEQSWYIFEKGVLGALTVGWRWKTMLRSSGFPPPADVLRAGLLLPPI